MARMAIDSDDLPLTKEIVTRAERLQELRDAVPDKRFEDFSAQEKDALLRLVAFNMGLIKL